MQSWTQLYRSLATVWTLSPLALSGLYRPDVDLRPVGLAGSGAFLSRGRSSGLASGLANSPVAGVERHTELPLTGARCQEFRVIIKICVCVDVKSARPSPLSAPLLSFGPNLKCVTCQTVVPVAVNQKVFSSSVKGKVLTGDFEKAVAERSW